MRLRIIPHGPIWLFLSATPALAAITDAQVSGTTSLQAIVTYTAPDKNPCTLQVSESPSLSPLVHDVDPSLFAGANSDGGGSLARVWVIGRRKADKAADGKRYSRALQCNTKHYYQLTCGSDQVSGNFTTSNIPLGRTYAETVPIDRSNPGQYALPDYDPNNRNNQTIIDPNTGILLKPVSIPNDTSYLSRVGMGWSASGSVMICDPTLSNGGYHCGFPAYQNNLTQMYWINPQTGEVRNLGWPSTVFIPHQLDAASPRNGWNVSGFDVFHVTLWPNDQGVAQGNQIGYTLNGFYPNLVASAQAFTANDSIPFDPSQFGCGLTSAKANHLVVNCFYHEQDSPGWTIVLDVSGGPTVQPAIIAATPIFANPRSRWCGVHTAFDSGEDPIALNKVIHLWNLYELNLTAAIGAGDSTIQVSGEPASTNVTSGPAHLLDAAAGDYFQFRDGSGEVIQIAQKLSPTTWVINRAIQALGYHAGTASHAAGTALVSMCSTNMNSTGDTYWRYLDDPHGQDATNQFFIADYNFEGDHNSERGQYRVKVADSGYNVATGGFTNLNVSPQESFSIGSSFAGDRGAAFGNSVQAHPSYLNLWAPGVEKSWFLDMIPFVGDAASIQPVGGFLYKYSAAVGIHPKTHAIFGITVGTPLVDVSGPGSVLTGAASDAYKFCIVENAGECVAGSQVGDVYFNANSSDIQSCQGNGGATLNISPPDICIFDQASRTSQVAQFSMLSREGVGGSNSRGLTYGLVGYRNMQYFASAKALPDGSWTLFPVDQPDGTMEVWMAKIPPLPTPDGIDRTNFINVPVNPGTFPGAASASVQYGYEENGPVASFYCRQRQETCAIPATLGTSLNIPGIPQRVLYHRIQYFDSSNNLIGQSKIAAVVVDQASSTPALPSDDALIR
jgi:hypothetical protein